jgi:hypothetical protein
MQRAIVLGTLPPPPDGMDLNGSLFTLLGRDTLCLKKHIHRSDYNR